MLRNITYFAIFDKPLIFYLGILTILSFFITATIGYLFHHGNQRVSFSWHMNMAYFSLGLATIHGILGILAYL